MTAEGLVPKGAEPRTLDEVFAWRSGVSDSLSEHRALILARARRGEAVRGRFLGMNESDVDVYFELQQRDLDRLTIVGLMAAAEAWLRRDYHRRVRHGRKRNDPLSTAYRQFHRGLSGKQKRRPPYDEGGILDALKASGVVDKNIVGRFRECLPVRHWVAHGRADVKPDGLDRLSPVIVYARADELLRAIPA